MTYGLTLKRIELISSHFNVDGHVLYVKTGIMLILYKSTY